MNVLIVSAVFKPEPVVSAKLSENIAENLAEKSNKVTVLAPKPSRPLGFKFNDEQTKSSKFTLINLPSHTSPESSLIGRLRESYSFGKHCKKYIRDNSENIDVIYMNSWPIFAQYKVARETKKQNIKLVTHIQDIYPESLINKVPKLKFLLNLFLLSIDKFVLRNSANIIAISKDMKNYISKSRGIDSEKIEVVKNWQNEDDFIKFHEQKKEISLNNDFTFMYLGNIGPVAGVDLIIEAFFKANLDKAKLMIAGDGSKKEELEKMVKENEIKNVFFESVADGEVPKTQHKATVMMLPIKKGAASSSIPSKLPAYMFSKKPVLASVDKDTETYNIIQESQCGWCIEPEEIALLSDKMVEIYNLEGSQIEQKGLKGFEYALSNLSKKENLDKISKIILSSNVN